MTVSMLSISESSVTPREGYPTFSEIDHPVFTVVLEGVSVVADAVMYVYRGTQDVTSSVTTGNVVINNGSPVTVTSKTLLNLTKGTYTIAFAGTVDGMFITFCKLQMMVEKVSEV